MSNDKENTKNENDSKESTVVYHKSELEYFESERDNLQSARDRYLSETKKPERKEYFPDVFNDLEPYTDLEVYNKALETPEETPRNQYKTRRTASGLCDPWVSHDMDINFEESRPTSVTSSSSNKNRTKGSSTARGNSNENKIPRKDNRQSSESRDKERRQSQSSTAPSEDMPMYPTVKVTTNEFNGKQLDYSHVPKLREELRKTYSENAEQRIERDYKVTKKEFYKRRLDKVNEYHPDTWPTMRLTYLTYLQNNKGSAKAVRECVEQSEQENSSKDNGKDGKKKGQSKRRSTKSESDKRSSVVSKS